ncbi:MAG: hypothetical protein L0K86_08710, partial [Actinomycetia bacterium]|nr:hypothetical protein [Actinomycetes bacterium]
MTAKETLRAEAFRRRAGRDEPYLEAAGAAIAALLPRIDAVKHASCVALYLSMDTEPPTWPL